MKIFSGTSNPRLAQKISDNLNLPLGKIYHKTFASNEKYCQFHENVRGSDVFLIQSSSFPANDNLMELLIMSDAARRASAKTITAVVPMFFYQRQERKEKSRVPISAKLVMNMLEAAGATRIVTMDLHAPQIGGFSDRPVDHLYFKPTFISYLKEKQIEVDVVVSPDIGAVKRSQEYADDLHTDLAVIHKRRLSDTNVEIKNFIGDVKGKRVLIVDDLTESLGTLTKAAIECRARGALRVYVGVTHGCFSQSGVVTLDTMIDNGTFDMFFYSNTIPTPHIEWYNDSPFDMNNVVCIDVAPVFATAIRRIYNNESVSELF